MSIDDFYNTTFTVFRNEWKIDEDDNRYSELEEVGDFVGHLQQATKEMVQHYGLNFQTAFTIWCDVATDIKLADVITNGDYKYSVKAIQTNNYGENTHLEILVEGGLTQESGS